MSAPRSVEVRAFRPEDRPRVLAMAADGQWAALRYLSLFGYDVAGAEQADRVGEALDRPGVHLVALQDGEIVGQASAGPVDDLTEHFDLPFHELGPLLTRQRPGVARAVVVGALLSAVREAVGPERAVLTVRIEGDDVDGLLGAEEAGYRVRETTTTFVNDLERRHRNPPLDVGDAIRVHRFGVDADLPASLFAGVRGQASQVKLDHYHADPRLPDERCDALYERVLDRVLSGVGADVLVLRFRDEQLVGFGSWRAWAHLETYGVAMAGSSFGLRARGAPMGNLYEVGAYVCNESLTGNRLLEWTTQVTNYPMINMLCRQPSIRLCRSSMLLHGWTDEAWD